MKKFKIECTRTVDFVNDKAITIDPVIDTITVNANNANEACEMAREEITAKYDEYLAFWTMFDVNEIN